MKLFFIRLWGLEIKPTVLPPLSLFFVILGLLSFLRRQEQGQHLALLFGSLCSHFLYPTPACAGVTKVLNFFIKKIPRMGDFSRTETVFLFVIASGRVAIQ